MSSKLSSSSSQTSPGRWHFQISRAKTSPSIVRTSFTCDCSCDPDRKANDMASGCILMGRETSAPCLSNNSATSRWPWMTAACRAVMPSTVYTSTSTGQNPLEAGGGEADAGDREGETERFWMECGDVKLVELLRCIRQIAMRYVNLVNLHFCFANNNNNMINITDYNTTSINTANNRN